MMDRAWITIITNIGAFAVSLLSIYLGYALFIAGATGEFKLSGNLSGGTLAVISVAPGLGFALFGMIVAVATIWKSIGRS